MDTGASYIFQGWNNAGQALSGDLQKALAMFEENRKQRDFDTGLLDTLKSNPATSKYIDPEILQNWDKWSNNRRAGAMAGTMRVMTEDRQQQQANQEQQLKAAQIARMAAETKRLSNTPQLFTMTDPTTGQPITFYQGAHGPVRVPNQSVASDPRNGLTKSLSKYGLTPEDMNSIDKDSLDFVGPNGESISGSVAEAAPKMASVVGRAGDKTFKVPKPVWDSVAQQYLNTRTPDGSTGTVAAPTTTAAPPPKSTSAGAKVPAGRVAVKGPDGKTYSLPAGQVQQALAQGYSLMQ